MEHVRKSVVGHAVAMDDGQENRVGGEIAAARELIDALTAAGAYLDAAYRMAETGPGSASRLPKDVLGALRKGMAQLSRANEAARLLRELVSRRDTDRAQSA